MKALLPRVVPVLVLLLCAGAAPEAGEEDAEWVRPYIPFLPGFEPAGGDGEKDVVAVRLLRDRDDGLRTFVPHGAVRFFTEECDPVDTGARLVAGAEGDEYGFVNVVLAGVPDELRKRGYHWHFEAPGHGAAHDASYARNVDREVWLPGGVDREIRVIDPFGRPLAGAAVSMYLGCPHSPALRSGSTDDEGVVRLANLPADREGDYWIEAPGIRFGPYNIEPRWVGQGGDTILTEPARTARGAVIDEAGAPIAGVVVRESSYPRGPVTTTGKEGRFVLHGVPWGLTIRFYRSGSPSLPRPDSIVRDFEEDVPLRVTLRDARPTMPTDGEARHAVDVVASEKDLETAAFTPVGLTRLSDGYTLRGATAHGVFRALVPAGRYRVTAGGGFSRHGEVRTEIDLPRPDGGPVRIQVAYRQTGLQVVWAPDGRRRERPVLRIPGREKELGYRQNHSINVPPGVPVGLFVRPPARVVPVEGWKVVVDTPPQNRIRFRVQDENGEPVEPGAIGIDYDDLTPERQEDGSYEVRTWACGRTEVSFGGFFGKSVVADLPTGEAGLVELGTIVIPDGEEPAGPRRTIHLRFGDGTPLAKDDLALCSWPDPDGSVEWAGADPDDDGAIRVPSGRGLISVLLEGPGIYPCLTEVRPDGPPEIRLPAGTLTGELRGPDGKPIPGVVYVDAARYECAEGKLAIRGVPDGPHIVIAGAKDHVGEVRRIVVREGGARELSFALPRR